MSNRQDRPLAKKLLHALGLLALALFLLYVAVQFVLIFHRSYKTETAIRYTLAESLNLTGVVAFDAVDVPGSGNLGYLVQDGERVTNGTVVAECYTDDTQGLQRERLDRLERSITLLTKSQNSAGSELSVLTNQTKQALYNLLDKLDTAQYTGISDAQDSFLLAQNRLQISTGQTAGFTQTIAALQEAGSKLSRDMLKSAYRAFAKQCYLIIELMRQFYDEQRVFRIVGESGESRFVPFSAQALRAVPGGSVGGVELGSREPIFDIVVSAAKKSTFSRLSQNETAKECYQLGFFKPENADAALAALEMMDFEGIEKVRQRVRQNGTLAQQLARMQQQMAQMAAVIAQQGTGPDEPARSAGGASAQTDGQAVKLAGLGNALPVAAAARAMNIH